MAADAGVFPAVQPFYSDARIQLNATKHFGVLGTTLEREDYSRLHYVNAHSGLLRRIKILVPGLGLGRHNCFPAKEQRWACLQSLNGVEICQAWAVLLNAGHLFGTFATERGLLFHLDKHLDARNRFIHECSAFDHDDGNTLRPWLEDRLDRPRLHDFFYLLALWRLRDGGVSNLQDADRLRARRLVECFVRPPSRRIEEYAALFRRTRQLVYLPLHNDIQDRGLQVDIASDNGLRDLFPSTVLADDQWYSRGRWAVLTAVDRHDASTLFASDRAASAVLTHIQHFKAWLRERADIEVARSIDSLFSQPEDWHEPPVPPYERFATLQLSSGLDWMSEARLWLRDENAADPWGNANFLVTPDPAGGPLQVDIYERKQGLPLRALRHAVIQLTRAFAVPPGTGSRALWHSTAQLALRVFRSCLADGLSLRVTPTHGAGDHTGYASVGGTYEFVRGLVRRFISQCSDTQRREELRCTLMVADGLQRWRQPAIFLLGKVELLDANHKVLTDIDGLVGFFISGRLCWYAIEVKSGSQRGGKGQLQRRLVAKLRARTKEVQGRKVGQCKVWFVEIRSPSILT
jgi:hypothetical protein